MLQAAETTCARSAGGCGPASRESDGSRWVAAEKGYPRETGNLVFHLALLFVLLAVAVGGLFGWKGNVIVREGTGLLQHPHPVRRVGRRPVRRPGRARAVLLHPRPLHRRLRARRRPARRAAPVRGRRHLPGEPGRRARRHDDRGQRAARRRRREGVPRRPRLRPALRRARLHRRRRVRRLRRVPAAGRQLHVDRASSRCPTPNPSLGLNGLFLPTAALDRRRRRLSTFPAPDNPAVFLRRLPRRPRPGLGRPAERLLARHLAGCSKIGLESMAPGQTWTLPERLGHRGVHRLSSGGRPSRSPTTRARSSRSWRRWPRSAA